MKITDQVKYDLLDSIMKVCVDNKLSDTCNDILAVAILSAIEEINKPKDN